jgi:hypothetical protein
MATASKTDFRARFEALAGDAAANPERRGAGMRFDITGARRLPYETVQFAETHKSLFDGSNCGIAITGKKAFSVQYHPEASPGPQDSFYLFEKFVGGLK